MALQTHSGIEAPIGMAMLGWGGVTSEDPIFAAVFVEDTDTEMEALEAEPTAEVPTYVEPSDGDVESYNSTFTPYDPTYEEA